MPAPWDPLTRPRIWVLHQGQWAEGELLSWHPPGSITGYTPEDGWIGMARWYRPDESQLQHQFALAQRWLAPRWDDEAERAIPAPEVPEGETGFDPMGAG